MGVYRRDFDETKSISFLMKDEELLEKYKIFHNNKIPREGSQFICLSVILKDSVFRTGKNYYPQVFLEECKYVAKEKKIPKYIIDDMAISSDSDKEDSDEENSNEGNSDKILKANF